MAQESDPWVVLSRGSIYVHPTAKRFVDVPKLERTVADLKPTDLKILVVPSLGSKWRVQSGEERRGAFSIYAFEKQLNMRNGIFIVFTKQGITAYSDRLGDASLAALNNQARGFVKNDNYTDAIDWLARRVNAAGTQKAKARTTAGGSIAAVVLGGVAVAGLAIVGARKARIAFAREAASQTQDKALDAIGYLDSYADLLAPGPEQTAVRDYRERAMGLYEQGRELRDGAKTADEMRRAGQLFEAAAREAELGKPHIEAATGGTKVAFTIPPKVTDTTPTATPSPLFQPFEGVCFFCSRPGQNDLTQVVVNVNGQRRSVLACPADRAEMERGFEPQMRGQVSQGRFVPWYMTSGYNPHTMYGSGGFVWDLMTLSLISHMFNPFWSVGMINHSFGNTAGYDPGWAGGASLDNQTLTDLDQSGSFGGFDLGGTDFGGSSGDWGGGDFGGGDFGGGDFGGGGD